MTEDDEQMQLAFRMSLQQDASMANAESTSHHVAKRVKAGEDLGPVSSNEPTARTETAEARERRIQREVRAAAAERRLAALAGQQAGGVAPRDALLQLASAPPPAASCARAGSSPSGQLSAVAVGERLSDPAAAAEHSSAGQEHQMPALTGAGSAPEVMQQADESARHLAADVEPSESRWQQLHGLQALPLDVAFRLFDVVFGREVPRQTLTQWSHQGLQ